LVDMLSQPVGMETLDALHDLPMEGAPSLLQEARVGDVVREGMLEGVREIREEPRLVEELSGLQVAQAAPDSPLRSFGDRLKKRQRHILADDGGGLEKPFVLGREPVNARGQDRLGRRWNLQRGERPRQMVSASLAGKGLHLDQCPNALLEEEGIALGPLDQ